MSLQRFAAGVGACAGWRGWRCAWVVAAALVLSGRLLVAEEASPRVTLPTATAEQLTFFEERVRPVLAGHCYQCHGAKKQESGLRLDTRAGIAAGGDAGPVIVPGNPEQSPLVLAVRRTGDVQMPPNSTLAAQHVQALEAWIKQGAPWPAETPTAAKAPGPVSLTDAREKHWAFQPVRRPVVPAGAMAGSAHAASAPVDAFIRERLAERKLAPSSPADRRTLIRRLTYDLHGLAPTWDDVEAFVADESPDATERLLDRLLAAPQYGERWGRHWLDVARYSDTRGYNFARERRFPYAFTYRDYVIGAFNRDLPYDRFVTEQIAADRLNLGEDKRPLAALGLLTVGRRHNNEPDDVDDRIDVVSRGLLGLTVSCARCHDHKFDPIPSEDYYSLYGVLASCQEPAEQPVIGPPADRAKVADFERRLAELRREQQQKLDRWHGEIVDACRKRTGDYLAHLVKNPVEKPRDRQAKTALRAEDLRPRIVERWRRYFANQVTADHAVFGPWRRLLDLPDGEFATKAKPLAGELAKEGKFNPLVRDALAKSDLKTKADVATAYGRLLAKVYAERDQANPAAATRELRQVLLADGTPTAIPRDEAAQHLNVLQKNEMRDMQRKIDAHLAGGAGSSPRAMSVVDSPRPYEPYVFIRGNERRRGKSVPRQFLAVVAGPDRKPFTQGSGRLELAQAIAAPTNPLTARVIVNRVWMHHFGQPLVETPSDFGVRTPPPSHPELLDYLASELVEHGWSLKRIQRAVLASDVYQQRSQHRDDGAAADPENKLLWKMNRRRLEFEAVRDSLAQAAGTLDTRLGGQPVELLATPFTTRRTVYGFVDRQDLPNLFRVFDFASPDQSVARRPETTVPQQALFLLNAPFVFEQSLRLATRADVTAAESTDERVVQLYRAAYGRKPTAEELTVVRGYLGATPTPATWHSLAQALLAANEFVFVD